MGEAAGEADLSVTYVDGERHSDAEDDETVADDGDVLEGAEPEAFKLEVSPTDELRFSRKKRRESLAPALKRAWVVSPGEYPRVPRPQADIAGMGHIG